MGDDAPGRSEHGFRRARRKISRQRQGVRQALNDQLARRPPEAARSPVHSRLQHDVRRRGLPAGAAHPRCESPRRPSAVHLGVARKAHGLCLRPQQRDRGPRRPRAHAASAARQQRGRGQRARPLDGQSGHCRSVRQIEISGDLRHADKIGYVFLAAPDIDIDVFKSQMRRFGKPRKPFYIILSQDDRALFLSKASPAASRELATTPMSRSLPRWARRSST